ncbi:Brefeldin A resistance protein-like protein [Emericellopsis cladophorae]|uniref:Brefeldin A resistance protein-like protein n=1 Tax=Emericellopsis cladophorae TaxID=2686198 RepID=A0A9P9XZG9_9HYPO|nr:Brefeldin A resistance protein-like protein [Emericellopsis cladophorae]KAI6780428.1 Brefeldin A resistance protein-like protein [Emericellopsis cladophorae]
MAEETNSPKTSPVSKEDAETRAARRELKQHSISEPASTAAADANERPETPATEGEDAAPAEDHVLSPKKKRAHDQLDSGKVMQDKDVQSGASTDSAKDRASRSEPEKKRPRDGESKESTTEDDKKTGGTDAKPDTKKSQTSSSAFAASGFGKLAAGGSGFASLGGGNASPFGAAAGKPMTSFASPTKPTKPSEAPKLSFGGGTSASPFAGLSSGSNGFGSALGGGSAFGASSGSKLGSFAAPGSKPAFGNDKPAKAFGAPESDVEDDEDDDNDDDESKDDKGDEERAASPEKEDDKKKARLQKVEVNDGEQGEVTVVSVRAKVFHLDKEVGWKERGSGMLKINVPVECVELDHDNNPIPGSFDASGFELEDEEAGAKPNKVARLILRQDQTHRVILNTAIAPAMEFQEKATLKSVGIVFTAFEGDGAGAKPVNITAKMTAANAKIFMNEVKLIQRELRGI